RLDDLLRVDAVSEFLDLAFVDQGRRTEKRPVPLPAPDGAFLLEDAQGFANGPAADLDLNCQLAPGGHAAAIPRASGKMAPQRFQCDFARGFRRHDTAPANDSPGTITDNWFHGHPEWRSFCKNETL